MIEAHANKLAKTRQELSKVENDLAMVEQKWIEKQEEYDATVA